MKNYLIAGIGGTLAGQAWDGAGWPAVALLAGGLTAGAVVLSVVLGRTRALHLT